ncbi:MAG: hypothetical protein ACYS5V_08770, partial [Planctomycetota bacterium]
MFDPKRNTASDRGSAGPQFEALEERLMLTTINAGEWFVYNDSMNRFVLVTMTGKTGTAEIMAQDIDTGDMKNISGQMGAMDGTWGPTDVFGGLTGQAPLDTILGTAPYLAPQLTVLGLGGNTLTREMYSFDNLAHELWKVDPVTGANVPGSNVLITESGQPGWGFNIDAMTVDQTGMILAAGQVVVVNATPPPPPVPAGRFLIMIDPGAATGSIIDPTAPLPVTITDLAILGGQLYGTDGGNIFTVDPATGQIGALNPLVDITNNNTPVANVTGLEALGAQLYICNDVTVYTVDNAGNCTPLNGTLSLPDMRDLASDGVELYGVYSGTGDPMLALINTTPPANVDPFAVYVSEADMSTKLTFTEVGRVTIGGVVTPAIPQLVATSQVRIELYQPATTPFVNFNGGRAPGGSGGVLIGGVPSPTTQAPFRHVATPVTGPVGPFRPVGVFPGGELRAGVTIACSMGTIIDNNPGDSLGQSVSTLAADSTGTFYAVDNLTGELVQIEYTPEVPASNGYWGDMLIPPIAPSGWSADGGAPTITPVSVTPGIVTPLTDSVEPAWIYRNIQALEFDAADTLYAIGSADTTDPGIPAPGGLWLLTIDPGTAAVTRLAQLDPEISKYHGLVIDGGGNFTAIGAWVHPVTGWTTENTLVQIDPVTGTLTELGELTYWGASLDLIEGLDYFDTHLYATTGTMLYVVNGIDATPLAETGVDELSDLAGTSTVGPQGRFLWSVTYDQGYKLVKLDLLRPAQDFGKLAVAGVIAGSVHGSGSIDAIEMGHLWGNVEVDYDLKNLVVRTDVSTDPDNPRPDNALIRVGGAMGELDIYGTMWGTVSVGGRLNSPHVDSHLSDANFPVWRDPDVPLTVEPVW